MRKSIYTPEYAVVRQALRHSRLAAGLSQRDLASRLRVPPSWVAKAETGERRVDVVEFLHIIQACGAKAETVFARIATAVQAPPASGKRGGTDRR
jgi:transcriptional regulator with XRE-family HTH domain